MNILYWSLLTIPMMLAFLLLYGCTGKVGKPRWGLIAKSGGSFVAAATSAALCLMSGVNPLTSLIFWGLILCCIADTMLEISFPVGILVFGGGHILFLIFIIGKFGFHPVSIVIWAVLYIVILLIFGKELRNIKGNKLIYYFYPAFLLAVVSVALPLPFLFGNGYIVTAIGAALFAFSDSLVARGFFGKNGKLQGAVIMTSYYAALYLLALTPVI